MLTNAEQEVIREFGETLKYKLAEAIRSKPIRRRTPAQGSFEAPVNASGRLAESVESVLEGNTLNIKANDYIWYLVFGRPPTSSMGSGEVYPAIVQWLEDKGLDISPYAVTHNIHKYGTSIWQEHQGNESGLIDDILTQQAIDELADKLVSVLDDGIRIQLFNAFEKAA